MHCIFEGAFAEEAKSRIRASLRTLHDTAGEPYTEEGPHWHVSHDTLDGVSPGDGALTLRARNPALEIDIMGRSVDHLVEEIHKAAEAVRGAGFR